LTENLEPTYIVRFEESISADEGCHDVERDIHELETFNVITIEGGSHRII